MTPGEGSTLVRETVEQVINQGHKAIVLDLEGVGYIDSAGLGELVGCNTLAAAHGARIKLAHLRKECRDCFRSPNSSPSSKPSTTKMKPCVRFTAPVPRKSSCASPSTLLALPRSQSSNLRICAEASAAGVRRPKMAGRLACPSLFEMIRLLPPASMILPSHRRCHTVHLGIKLHHSCFFAVYRFSRDVAAAENWSMRGA